MKKQMMTILFSFFIFEYLEPQNISKSERNIAPYLVPRKSVNDRLSSIQFPPESYRAFDLRHLRTKPLTELLVRQTQRRGRHPSSEDQKM